MINIRNHADPVDIIEEVSSHRDRSERCSNFEQNYGAVTPITHLQNQRQRIREFYQTITPEKEKVELERRRKLAQELDFYRRLKRAQVSAIIFEKRVSLLTHRRSIDHCLQYLRKCPV